MGNKKVTAAPAGDNKSLNVTGSDIKREQERIIRILERHFKNDVLSTKSIFEDIENGVEK